MATVESRPPAEHALLHGVPWGSYVALRELPENDHVRMTYDHGDLEIMSPSRRHQKFASLIGTLIEIWAIELDVDLDSCRTMTFNREDLDRGLEPDNCYYIQNEPLVRAKVEIDFAVDPPPDLAVEIDLTRKSLDKMAIYAAFGVPEVWRFDGRELTVHRLGPDAQYQPQETSLCLPAFPLAQAERTLGRIGTASDTALARSFRDWVRQHV